MRRAILTSLIAWAPVVARAQTTCSVAGASGKCSPTVSMSSPATITNPALLSFTVSPSSTLSATATVTDMDVVDGMTTGSLATVTVQGNRTWTIAVRGNSALWSATAGGWTTKPVSDLHWSLTPSGVSTALSTTDATMLSGSPGSGTPSTDVYFRPVVHWLTDKPGTYTMGITFTITAP
ncbi:MAG TPA: hypothetical protein VGQ56_15140 [Gemmatimonadaceae bacterium]|jgi:hypothetical protein|nr:hypothetical protein [Gemmatimonadaceae bacterium]